MISCYFTDKNKNKNENENNIVHDKSNNYHDKNKNNIIQNKNISNTSSDQNIQKIKNNINKTSRNTNNSEHILVLTRAYGMDPKLTRLLKGDRVLISLEKSQPIQREYGKSENQKKINSKDSQNIQANSVLGNVPENVVGNVPQCGDIEDLTHKENYQHSSGHNNTHNTHTTHNNNNNNNNNNSNSNTHNNTHNSTHNNTHNNNNSTHSAAHSTGLALIEPNLAVGQISYLSDEEVHITLKSRPRRLIK